MVCWSWVLVSAVLLHHAQGQYREDGLQRNEFNPTQSQGGQNGQDSYPGQQNYPNQQGGNDQGVRYYGGEDVCSYRSSGSGYRRFMLNPVRGKTAWTSTGTCKCEVKSTMETSVLVETQLSVKDIVGASVEINKNIYYDENECGPLIMLTADRTEYYICAQETPYQMSTHRMSVTVRPNEPLEFYVYNPDRHPLDSYVRVTGNDPYLTVHCQPTDRKNLALCPCHASNMGDIGNYTLALQHRAGLVAGVCILAILILIAIILVVVCLKKKNAATAKKETAKPTNALRDDNAFKREKAPRVSSNPDPSNRGSRDSGLPGNERTLEKDSEGGLNYPSMAGHGSQTSLDNPRLSSAGRTIAV